MPLGGKRPGAGRKKGKQSLEKEAAKKVVYDFVVENLKPILNGLLERAVGVRAIKYNKKGEEIIYSIPPDPFAGKTLLEQGVGKPPESIDHTSGGEKMNQMVIYVPKKDE